MSQESARGYAKGREKRERILDAAAALFGEVGYRGASLREIAARAGLSHPGLLHHFPTKEILLAGVLDQREERERAHVVPDEARGVEALHHLVGVVEHEARHPGLVELHCVLAAEATAPEHPAHDVFVARYTRVVGQWEAAFRAASDDGHLRDGVEPETEARTVLALVDGLRLQRLLSGGSLDVAPALRAHLDDRLAAPA